MNSVYLLLGSNIGNSLEQLKTSIRHIENNIGRVISRTTTEVTRETFSDDCADFSRNTNGRGVRDLPRAPIVEAVIDFRARTVEKLEESAFRSALEPQLPDYRSRGNHCMSEN